MFYDLPCVSIAFYWVLLTFHWVLPLSYLISSYLLILSYLFLVFCFPARFWCWDICDGFKYPRGYPHVQQRAHAYFQYSKLREYPHNNELEGLKEEDSVPTHDENANPWVSPARRERQFTFILTTLRLKLKTFQIILS